MSFVKTGKRPASLRLLMAVAESMPVRQGPNYIALFMQSRKAIGVSPHTIEYYKYTLGRYVREVDYLKATKASINRYLDSIPPNQYGLATRHSAYRAIKTLYRWLQDTYDIPNPMKGIRAPILGKPILPTLDEVQVKHLINSIDCIRDKAIIALFVESGLRLSELVDIKASDINWTGRCIRVLGKGRKEAFAPFGDVAADYMRQWLANYKPLENIWGLNAHGIATMLRRLEAATGITCNPHTFRRTFAVLLRKAGVDTMTIKELGRWESMEMVQRYTRSFTFHDSMKFYRSPLT